MNPLSKRIHAPMIGLAATLLVAAVGCATAPKQPTFPDAEAAWSFRQARLSKQLAWGIDGRLAVNLQDEGWNAGLRWQQENEEFEIEILGVLGRKVAKLEGGRDIVRLTTSKGERRQAPNPELLMHEVLGWSLPLSGMRYWVLGIPDPSREGEYKLDSAGRLEELKQAGWEVRYEHYDNISAIDMPTKIILKNTDLKLKLLVKDWRLASI